MLVNCLAHTPALHLCPPPPPAPPVILFRREVARLQQFGGGRGDLDDLEAAEEDYDEPQEV